MLRAASRASWWMHPVLAATAAAVTFSLTLLLNLHNRPFLLPMIAVVLMALRGGFAAGVVCGITTLLLVDYYLVPPVGSLGLPSVQSAYELGIFSFTALIISALAGRERQAQLTLEATVASIGDGVIVTDETGRVTFLNRVAEELTGWPLADAVGLPVGRVFAVIDEETRQALESPVERAMRERALAGLPDRAVLLRRDRSERPIVDSGAPILDLRQRLIGGVLVFRDALHQRQVEESLKEQARERQQLLERERQARAEAEHANTLKDEFLATLSHELRTPLNAVLGWSHLLIRRRLTAAQESQAVAAIHRNAQAQARLVDDVLDLSKIVTGRLVLSADAVDVSEVMRLTADSFAPAVEGKRQVLKLDLAPGAVITGDAHRLRQIFWNVLSNAMKFTPEGGTVTAGVHVVGRGVRVTVSDTGQGVPPAFLPFIFDRFRQADSSTTRGHGGLGLGLSLVRTLVEAHGGTVSAASAGEGHGTTIVMTFPARRPAHGDQSGDNVANPAADVGVL